MSVVELGGMLGDSIAAFQEPRSFRGHAPLVGTVSPVERGQTIHFVDTLKWLRFTKQ